MTLASMFVASVALALPISYGGGTYTQDFNGLPTTGNSTLLMSGPHDIQGVLGGTGVSGWTMSNYAGSSADTEYRAQDGSLSGSSGRGVVSYGTTGSGERALGTLATSNQISRFGVAFTNDTGSTLTTFNLSFTGEQWRRGDIAIAPFDSLSYQYSLTAANINSGTFTGLGSFTSPNLQATTNVALNGNLPANQVPVAVSVSNISWSPGATLTIRWNGTDITGQDDGLSIDNVSFSASVPEPTTWSVALLALVGLPLIRKRS